MWMHIWMNFINKMNTHWGPNVCCLVQQQKKHKAVCKYYIKLILLAQNADCKFI